MCSNFYDMPSHHGYNRVYIVTFSVDNYYQEYMYSCYYLFLFTFNLAVVGILLHMHAHN